MAKWESMNVHEKAAHYAEAMSIVEAGIDEAHFMGVLTSDTKRLGISALRIAGVYLEHESEVVDEEDSVKDEPSGHQRIFSEININSYLTGDIDGVCGELVRLARLLQVCVSTEFNNIHIYAFPWNTPGEVRTLWETLRK